MMVGREWISLPKNSAMDFVASPPHALITMVGVMGHESESNKQTS